MNPALVIAARSFVGRHLCAHLDRLGIPYRPTSQKSASGFLPCDLTNAAAVNDVIAKTKPRWIFACAGATSNQSRDDMQHLHVRGTLHLLRAVERFAPEAVSVLFGSAAEYGAQTDLPVSEDAAPNPASAYGQSKLEMTNLATHLAMESKLRVVVVRPFNLLGPGIGSQYFAGALCERLRKARFEGRSGPMPIQNGHATRDWVDVRDAVDAVIRLAERPPESGRMGLFNIASGIETPVIDIATTLCQSAGDFAAVPAEEVHGRSRIDRSCGDASRLRAWTNWTPTFALRQTVQDMWEYSAVRQRAA